MIRPVESAPRTPVHTDAAPAQPIPQGWHAATVALDDWYTRETGYSLLEPAPTVRARPKPELPS